jgi:hypothetical protein
MSNSDICIYCGMQYSCDLQMDNDCKFFTLEDEDDMEEYKKVVEQNMSTKELIREINKDLGLD